MGSVSGSTKRYEKLPGAMRSNSRRRFSVLLRNALCSWFTFSNRSTKNAVASTLCSRPSSTMFVCSARVNCCENVVSNLTSDRRARKLTTPRIAMKVASMSATLRPYFLRRLAAGEFARRSASSIDRSSSATPVRASQPPVDSIGRTRRAARTPANSATIPIPAAAMANGAVSNSLVTVCIRLRGVITSAGP